MIWLWSNTTAASCFQGAIRAMEPALSHKSGINWSKIKREVHKGFKERLFSLWGQSNSGTGPRDAGPPLSLAVFKVQLDKALRNPVCSYGWPCFQQEVGLETNYVTIHQKPSKLFLPFPSGMKKKQMIFIKNESLTNILAPISSSCFISDKTFPQCPSFSDV